MFSEQPICLYFQAAGLIQNKSLDMVESLYNLKRVSMHPALLLMVYAVILNVRNICFDSYRFKVIDSRCLVIPNSFTSDGQARI